MVSLGEGEVYSFESLIKRDLERDYGVLADELGVRITSYETWPLTPPLTSEEGEHEDRAS